ncbi:MAG: hypothetical protein JO157_04415 [Acetobacteraceae bacterium]|nr:hypothetical protein [Acetobacteraceae bacterium]
MSDEPKGAPVSDEGSVRRFQGRQAVFVAFKGSDEIEMRVGDRIRTLAKADWLCLPLVSDREACRVERGSARADSPSITSG